MTARDRTQNTTFSGGSFTLSGGSTGSGTSYTQVNRCADSNPGPGALYIEHTTFKPVPISGSRTTISGTTTFRNYVTPPMVTFPGHSLPAQSDSADATKAASRSNPSRPEVDLPVFFAELRDIPRMIKFFGDQALHLSNPKKWSLPSLPSLGGNIGSWNLQYQFGLRPLISDVGSLLNMGESLSSRKKEIDSLYKKGGLRRRISLGIDTNTITDSITINSTGGGSSLISGTRTSVSSRKRWAVVRWLPTTSPPAPEDRDLMAARAVLGLNASASQIWELIPWSWLIDYCSSAGDYLAANRNFVPARISSVWVMKHIKQSVTITRTSGPSWLSGGSSSLTKETKHRNLGLVTPFDVGLPYLSSQQSSILSSLALVRARRL